MPKDDHILDEGTFFLCRATQVILWLVMLASWLYTILLLAIVLWGGLVSLRSLWSGSWPGDLIAQTLKFLEYLLLSPLPFMVGGQLYNWSLQLGRKDLEEKRRRTPFSSIVTAKSLVIGLMVSAVGVNLVERFLKGDEKIEGYLGGVLVIGALIAFYYVLQRESESMGAGGKDVGGEG